MRAGSLIFVAAILLASQYTFAQMELLKPSKKKTPKPTYEEVDFEGLIQRYFGKDLSHPVEGIYSVSCVITKAYKPFLSRNERTKVVARKDNYARVAILKDWPGSKRDFIELSMSFRDTKKYPIVGELNSLSEGAGLIYKHLEPNGETMAFSMISDSGELLEAEYSDLLKRKTITYRLSYLKIFPKASDDVTVVKD